MSEPQDPSEAPKRGPRPVVVAAIVGVVVGAAVGVGVFIAVRGSGGNAHPPKVAVTALPTTTAVPLAGAAQQLVALLSHSAAITYHAGYTLTSTDPQAQGGTVAIEVWHQPPLVRQDTSVNAAGNPGGAHNEQLVLPSGLVDCAQTGTSPWSCRQSGSALPSGPDVIVSQVVKSLAQSTVTVSSATVAGQAARCFTVSQATTVVKICLNADGVLLQVTAGAVTMTMTELDASVPAATFTPPGPVSPAADQSRPGS